MRPLSSDAQKHDRWNRDGGGSLKDCSPRILVTVVTFRSFENIFLLHNISVCCGLLRPCVHGRLYKTCRTMNTLVCFKHTSLCNKVQCNAKRYIVAFPSTDRRGSHIKSDLAVRRNNSMYVSCKCTTFMQPFTVRITFSLCIFCAA